MHQNTSSVVTHLGVSDSTQRIASHLLAADVNKAIKLNPLVVDFECNCDFATVTMTA